MVTIALALGAQRMVRRNALIRKVPAVETLGSVTTICSDKTGTLTENRMTVTILDVAGKSLNLVQQLRVAGPIISPDEGILGRPDPSLAILLAGGALSNDATLAPDDDGRGGYHAVGDPTEGAMVVAAARHGLWKDELERIMPRRMEAPFSSERKRMTTVHERLPDGHRDGEGPLSEVVSALPDTPYIAFAKGAVDGLLQISDRVWNDGVIEPLDEEWRRRIVDANNSFAQEGVRVLGVAMRPLEELPPTADEDTLEQQLVFIGMTGMIDPPRPEVKQAVAECRTAGIRPVMITGDHPLTALNIARELGIAGETDGATAVITQASSSPPCPSRSLRASSIPSGVRSGEPRAQGQDRRGAQGAWALCRHDGRWGERRPGAQAGGHRRGHGHHGDGREQGGRRHGAAGR